MKNAAFPVNKFSFYQILLTVVLATYYTISFPVSKFSFYLFFFLYFPTGFYPFSLYFSVNNILAHQIQVF